MLRKLFIPLYVLVLAVPILVSAQSGRYEGDVLISFLGKAANSQELKDLKASYNCEMANEEHFLSKAGIELILRSGVLKEVHFYSASAVYGNFKGQLPAKLRFGMYSSEVKKILGKPTASYNSGYCEFELSACVVSCWFESGKLDQIGIALKGAI
ncbi:MAG: hypothetical protein U0T75_00505 [Chitinophagales bacterium]